MLKVVHEQLLRNPSISNLTFFTSYLITFFIRKL
jgi:hypothetical protein